MTTGFSQVTALDAAAFDSLIGEAVRGRSATLSATMPPPASNAPLVVPAPPPSEHIDRSNVGACVTAALPAGPVDSTPDAAALARQLGRSLRTAGPLLAADVVALSITGIIAEALMRLCLPQHAVAVGAAAPLALFPLIIGYWLSGLYSEVWIHPAVEMRQATHVATVALLSAAVAGLWAPPLAIWCGVAWPALVVLQPLVRAAARRCCAGRAWWGFPTLVIGSGSQADSLARLLMRSRHSGLRPALLTDPEGISRTSVVPVVNDPADLRSLVRAKGIRHAVLCLSELPTASVSRAFDQYGTLASHLLVVCEPPPLPALWGAQRVCGLGGVEVRNGLLLAPLRALKRAMDLCIAILTLTAGLPLLLAIAALVKLSSAGPVLYGHTRIGRYGRHFTAWKFRTMYRGADALLRQHFDRVPTARVEWDRDQKLRDDPRVTRVGRVLRRLSLDELPQMWNVLVGEMSVVGPRPIVDEEVAKYGEAFELYAGVRPGITGLWQVSGRTDVGYGMRVRLDGFYVRQWSPWLDAYILARTVVALLCRRGAY